MAARRRQNLARRGRRSRVSPVVAKIAAEHNVDVSQVRGTGEGGRVTKKDILAFVESRAKGEGRKESELPPWEQPGTGDLFKPTEEVYAPTPAAVSYIAPRSTLYPPRLFPAMS